MKILIATGIYPPDIGGPATYAKNLVEEFARRGNKVKVLAFGLEKKFPAGLRHLLYFFRVIFSLWGADLIIALDTFSVGFPAVLAAKIFGKKIIIRIGGDFLWESYVNKTGDPITLSEFNKNMPKLSLWHKVIFILSRFIMKNCSALVFNTEWQKDIFEKTYELDSKKSFVIENLYPTKNQISSKASREKIFLWSGRDIKLKNLETLKDAFIMAQKESSEIKLEISEKVSHDELMEKIKNCYAVILPSLSEVGPNFILEAISFGKPFILTKETGLYEKLKNVGVFADPLDKEDIKNKILFLADDKNYQEYSKKVEGFNFTHSWREIADEFLNI
jgi:glycosyltransferase involved in cell wall biosynthesis